MKKYLTAIFIILTFFLIAKIIFAQESLAQKLSGRILLQVESHGEAWYINPSNYKKYYLGRPTDAFALMQNLGIGITNANLEKIPIGLINYYDSDDDNDGLSNGFENTLGTDSSNPDSDNDGYNDSTEIINNYNPRGEGKLNIDASFTKKNLGKIFLQVEGSGQAWYINPADQKRYFLNKPSDAFTIMSSLSLGITDENITKILTGYYAKTPSACTSCQSNNINSNANQVFSAAASAIRSGDKLKAVKFFTPELQKAVDYTMDFLDAEGRLMLSNIMSGASLSSSSDNEKIYSTEIYFSLGGYKVPVNFYVKKQADESWLLSNL